MEKNKKKKIKLISLLLLGIFGFGIIIFKLGFSYALGNNLLISCNEGSVKAGDNITCELKLNLDNSTDAYAVSFDYDLPSGIKFSKFVPADKLKEFSYASDSGIVIGSDTKLSGNIVLGTLTLNTNQNISSRKYSIGLKKILISDSNDKLKSIDNVSTNVDVVSNPKTGPSRYLFVVIIMLLSIVSFIFYATVITRKKKKKV